jgi:hypothetical protein
MKPTPETPERLYLSRAALRMANLPAHIRAGVRKANGQGLKEPVAVVCASELLAGGREKLPEWTGSDTRYLVLDDVPEPALVRLPRILGVHRPDYRLYVTRDTGSVRRLLIGLSRSQPVLGIVDAYLLAGELYVLTSDFEPRCFPVRKISVRSLRSTRMAPTSTGPPTTCT